MVYKRTICIRHTNMHNDLMNVKVKINQIMNVINKNKLYNENSNYTRKLCLGYLCRT